MIASGLGWLASLMAALQSNAAQVGIKVNLEAKPINQLTETSLANSGGYNDPENDALINKTLLSGNMSYMYAWEDYLSKQLAQVWQPAPAFQLTEVANNLKGALPQSPTLSINPENWYFVK